MIQKNIPTEFWKESYIFGRVPEKDAGDDPGRIPKKTSIRNLKRIRILNREGNLKQKMKRNSTGISSDSVLVNKRKNPLT